MELTRDSMLEYLREPQAFNCTLKIQFTTIVQKSYGTEKRFFVPAPIITLAGEGWKNNQIQVYQFYKEQARQRGFDPDLIPAPTIEGVIGVYDVVDHPVLKFSLTDEVKSFLAKTLHIRHTESRNYIRMAVDLKYNSGCRLGVFTTDRIKVISKASKAKNPTNSIEFKYLGISSGQDISLSSRLKIPPVTRFITIEDDKFSFSTTSWNALTIHLIDLEKSPVDSLDCFTKNGPIHYGDVVRLVDKVTGMSLPRLRICKVEKNKVVVPDDSIKEEDREVLNQMQKVALQIYDEKEFTYLYLEDEGVTIKTEKNAGKFKQLSLGDPALFTICCTTELEYTFYQAMGPTWQDVFPSPICFGMNLDEVDASLTAPVDTISNFITGKNFTDDLAVWFGTFKCKTLMKSTEMIEFDVPQPDQLLADKELLQCCTANSDTAEVPILLVRQDGTIFPTGMTFNYRNVKPDADSSFVAL